MKTSKNICVYCASAMGSDPVYAQAAQAVGQAIGRYGHRLLYGGACCGTMGKLADAAMEAGAHVHGVIPEFFKDYRFEVIHSGLPEITRVTTMAQRKEILIREADLFLALPGSYGTLDELFETLALLQLKQISKPVFLLNLHGFYSPLLQQLDRMQDAGFLQEENRNLLQILHNLEEWDTVLAKLA